MIDLIVFILVCYGVSNIIVNGKICKPIREALKGFSWVYSLITCIMCTGFWVGLVVSIFSGRPLSWAFLSSGAVWIIHVVMFKLGAKGL
jgi:hypothetical protein